MENYHFIGHASYFLRHLVWPEEILNIEFKELPPKSVISLQLSTSKGFFLTKSLRNEKARFFCL